MMKMSQQVDHLEREDGRHERPGALRCEVLAGTYSQILGNLVDFFFCFEQKTVRRNSKNHKILERCEGKNVKLEKREKMTPWTQKSALIQPLTSL